MESKKVKEIKKALECCNIDKDCTDCPYSKIRNCIEVFNTDILTLINELEREKKEHGKKKFLRGWKLGIEEIAERLKEKLKEFNFLNNGLWLVDTQVLIDETLKEFINADK